KKAGAMKIRRGRARATPPPPPPPLRATGNADTSCPASIPRHSAARNPMTLTLRSPDFQDGGAIPSRFTCDGDDISPAREWSGAPPNAKSLALIVDDPDAPDPKAPKMTYVHWVLYNIPTSAKGIPQHATSKQLPSGARTGTNDFKKEGYGGPCPPIGRHRYFFKLYALDAALPDLGKATKADLEKAMKGHIVEQAELMGTYS